MASKKPDPGKTDDDGDDGKKSGKKKLVIIGVIVAALAAGAYIVGTKSAAPAESADAASTTTTIPLIDGCLEEPEAGAPETVVNLPQLSINLADGHYLRAGVSLGLCADVVLAEGEEFGTAPAQDIVVAQLSGASMDVLATAEGRESAKETLKEKISALYPGVVYEVFLVEFVMQ